MEWISDTYKKHLNSIDLPYLQEEKASLVATAKLTVQSIVLGSLMNSFHSESLSSHIRTDKEIHAKIKLVETMIEERRGL